MTARAVPATPSDYDRLSRGAVRLSNLRPIDVPVVLAVFVAATVLVGVVAAVPTNLAAAPVAIRLASIAVGWLFVGAGLVGVSYRTTTST